jgi:murein DD-endopeptidase MepM/ murein hydrolase activator NlpD
MGPGFELRDARARAVAEAEAESKAVEHEAFTGRMGARELHRLQIGANENFAALIKRAGADGEEAQKLSAAIRAVFNTDELRTGQDVNVYFEDRPASSALLTGVAFRAKPGVAITVSRDSAGKFSAHEILMPLTFETKRFAARVETSLYDTAVAGGATDREIQQLADIFAFDVDFQRDIEPGDTLEMVFERFRDDEGRTAKTGDLLFVSLGSNGKQRSYYRYQRKGDQLADWYDTNGKSARKFLMKTPINGARLSSGFGMRMHPILGYSLLHKGTDFAASIGTPIMAAGDGTVVQVGRNGGYGNYIKIRHGDGYETAYAHMLRFMRGVRTGQKVRQGQIIGYVGTTGRSTGPHLHYEVMYKGQQMNPMKLKVPVGRNLDGKDLAMFRKVRDEIDVLRAEDQRQADARPLAVRSVLALREPGLRGGYR